MTEEQNRFKVVYEGSGAKILLDGSPLCFLSKSKNDHIKMLSKRGKFYSSLKDIEQEALFSIELATKLRNQIDEVFNQITAAKKPKEEVLVEPNLDIKTWAQLKGVIDRNLHKRDKEFKFLLACIISLWFKQNDFIFSLMVAERGDGKSTMLKAFKDSELTFSVDTFTANAFAPGTASVGEELYSLLKDCMDRTLIVHDMSASLSLPREVKLKILGDITNSYDEDGLVKYSPGAGNKRYGGAYNFIGGITYRFLRSNWTSISNTGRFLYYKMRAVNFKEIIDSKKIPNKTELNAAVKGFLWNLIEKRKELVQKSQWNKIRIHKSSVKYMKDFFDVYNSYLRVSSYYDKNKKETVHHYDSEYKLENPIRRYNQAIMLLKAIAFLEGRDKVTMDDFRHIRQIFWGIDTKRERKAKLKLIEDEDDLPEFKGKKWNAFTLFEASTKSEREKLQGANKPDQLEPENNFDDQVIESYAEELEPPTPDYEEEPPEYCSDVDPAFDEEQSEMEKAHDRYVRKHGGE